MSLGELNETFIKSKVKFTILSWSRILFQFFILSDINECLEENGKCHHKCVNYKGTFRCQCDPGYILQADGRSCKCKYEKSIKDFQEELYPSCSSCWLCLCQRPP